MDIETISKEYLELNRQLHCAPRGFGNSGDRWTMIVLDLVKMHHIKSILDYGCGGEKLWKKMNKVKPQISRVVKYQGYDPCVLGREAEPRPADLVTCTDVLEHIEPMYLDNVLRHLVSLTRKVIFFNIALHAANKVLPDGRNAHLIQRSIEWWEMKIGIHFTDWHRNTIPSKRPKKDFLYYLVRP